MPTLISLFAFTLLLIALTELACRRLPAKPSSGVIKTAKSALEPSAAVRLKHRKDAPTAGVGAPIPTDTSYEAPINVAARPLPLVRPPILPVILSTDIYLPVAATTSADAYLPFAATTSADAYLPLAPTTAADTYLPLTKSPLVEMPRAGVTSLGVGHGPPENNLHLTSTSSVNKASVTTVPVSSPYTNHPLSGSDITEAETAPSSNYLPVGQVISTSTQALVPATTNTATR